jgi:uncharacterized FlaG/YvyC family protein
MLKGVEAVFSSSRPGAGYAAGLGSLPIDLPSKTYEEPTTSQPFTREKLDKILQALRSFAEASRSSLKFHVNEATGQVVVEVIAEEDGRVIRQIPPEAHPDLEARIDQMTGVLFSKRV